MLLPSQLTRMRLGCRWAPETAPPVAPKAEAPVAVPAAWARGDVARVTGHNDIAGDCVEAMAANAVQTAMSRAHLPGTISDDYTLGLYETLTGYRPGQPGTDRGTDPAVLFAWWQANPIGPFKLGAVTSIHPADENTIRRAVVDAGGVALILNLSVDQQNQRVWMPAGQPGSWGGHAVWADEYDGGLSFCTSWGEPIPIDASYFTTPGFMQAVYRLDLQRAA